jgi:ATP-binding cassette subfamily B protein
MLEKGRIVETGTPKELAGKDGWYAKYNQIEELGWKM